MNIQFKRALVEIIGIWNRIKRKEAWNKRLVMEIHLDFFDKLSRMKKTKGKEEGARVSNNREKWK